MNSVVERLRPKHMADEPLARAVISDDQRERRAAVSAYLVANNGLKSEAIAEIERLTKERDDLAAANDAIEIDAGITDHGNLWRFWSNKALELVDKLTAERTRAGTAERERDEAITANYRQAGCIHQCAAHLGPDASGTIEGLPLAVKAAVNERDEARRLLAEVKGALEQIACRHVTEQPLWWQIEARTMLSNIRGHNG